MSMLSKLKKWSLVTLVVLVAFLTPYVWSRIQSSANQIKVVIDRSAASPETERETLRVACYNIAHGRGLVESNWDGGDAATRMSRLDDIAALLREINADVVALNEVDFDTSWSNNVNQAAVLAEKAGYPFRVEERNLDFRVVHRTWRFGNAILSKYPISGAAVVDLPSFNGWETTLAGKKRGVRCDVNVGEQTFRVFGLHLSHRSENVRQLSAQHVVDLVRDSPHPCVVMGDMNSIPPGFSRSSKTSDGKNAIQTFDDSDELHRIDIDKPEDDKFLTFRSDKPNIIIDWIYLSPSLRFESHRVEPSLLSDHRPVIAEIGWK